VQKQQQLEGPQEKQMQEPSELRQADQSVIREAIAEEPSPDDGEEGSEIARCRNELSKMQSRLQESNAEGERLKAELLSADQVKAKMMEQYANKVFHFVCWYCIGVAVILLTNRNALGTPLSDTVLAIIAGSTAVSVIGLIGIVVGGLFGIGQRRAK